MGGFSISCIGGANEDRLSVGLAPILTKQTQLRTTGLGQVLPIGPGAASDRSTPDTCRSRRSVSAAPSCQMRTFETVKVTGLWVFNESIPVSDYV
ncbi:hypothetical protein MCP1_250003 [Candidatus Terasakiella magnetica]|nr:hypothetical protein MCP1_250003 [Candidatus Terasakiella magnetica]